jgi:hypothetical protein
MVRPPIVTVPLRDADPVFAATEYANVPLPVPAALTVIHAALPTAVQPQPLAAVTVAEPLPLWAAIVAVAGDTLTAQGTPAWVTATMRPPAAMVPLRASVAVFAATVYANVPLPEPLAPALMVIHGALLTAVHPQPLAAVTVPAPVPGSADIAVAAGDTLKVQGTAA